MAVLKKVGIYDPTMVMEAGSQLTRLILADVLERHLPYSKAKDRWGVDFQDLLHSEVESEQAKMLKDCLSMNIDATGISIMMSKMVG